MNNRYHVGARVLTPSGPGGVAYVRMHPPDYTKIAAVSVVLDSRRSDPNYTGTIFPASKITLCGHNAMVPHADDACPAHVWRCADCGYVYGKTYGTA